jgi:hypothetical protein
MTSTHKELADNYIKLSSCLLDIATLENSTSLQVSWYGEKHIFGGA